jgi:hypothetical protein
MHVRLAIITAVLATSACVGVDDAEDLDGDKADGVGPKLRPVTAEDRLEYLAQAEIWQPTEVATKDLRRGPLGAVGYEADPQVSMPCRFVEPEEETPGGKSPKYLCERAVDQKIVKVKYSRDELAVNASLDINGEVYGEPLGTRLFWALGFFADRNFTTKTFCQNCPSGDPFAVYSGSQQSRVSLREFRNTLVEDKLAGKKIEECTRRADDDPSKCEQTKEDQGWSWDELVARSRAPRVQIDALRLLAAFVQHADNKAANQRLLCVEVAADGRCARSVAFAQDLGTTFGARTLFSYDKAKLSAWRGVAVWKDPAKCQANLRIHASGTLSDPVVTEASRRFLADLMIQLTDAQIEDLFRGSRVDRQDPSITDPAQRDAIIADWVAVFKDKRAQLVNHTCPQ